jgi:hypothetical protein
MLNSRKPPEFFISRKPVKRRGFPGRCPVPQLSNLFCFAVVAALAIPACAAVPEDVRAITPYFDMSMAEGFYQPSQGNAFTGGEINAQAGLTGKINDSDSLLGLYNLLYNGPAFRQQDTQITQYREMSHNLNVEYRHTLLDEHWTFRPGISLTKAYTREDVTDTWGGGLYNYNSTGIQLAMDYHFGWFDDAGTITGQYTYHELRFPNYSDLRTEFQNPGTDAELAGGIGDQDVHRFEIKADWKRYFGGLSYSLMDYTGQQVVGSNGDYTGDLQRDHSINFDIGLREKFGLWVFAPGVAASLYRSNQTFLRCKTACSAADATTNPDSDVTLIADAYSYNQYELDLPLYINAPRDAMPWTTGFDAKLTQRVYTDRPPRDANDNYLSGSQHDTMINLTAHAIHHINDIADVKFAYTLTVAASNNHFESYMPYNYTGHKVSIAYDISF